MLLLWSEFFSEFTSEFLWAIGLQGLALAQQHRAVGMSSAPGQTKGLEVAAAWFDRHLGPAAG